VKQNQRFTSVIEIESRRKYPAEEEDDGKCGCSEFERDKVGSIELADALFAPDQVNEALLWEAVKHYRASLRQGTHRPRAVPRLPVPARSCGSRRARAAHVSARCVRLCGATATRCTDLSRAATITPSAQEAAGRVAFGSGSKLADGKLTIVDSLEIKEAKTKLYRAALDKLNVPAPR